MAVDSIQYKKGDLITITPEDLENLQKYSTVAQDLLDKLEQGSGTLKLSRKEFEEIQKFLRTFDEDLQDIVGLYGVINDELSTNGSVLKDNLNLAKKLKESAQGILNISNTPGGYGLKDLNRQLLKAKQNTLEARNAVNELNKKYQSVAPGKDVQKYLEDEIRKAYSKSQNTLLTPSERRNALRHWRALTSEVETYANAVNIADTLQDKARKSLDNWLKGGVKLGLTGVTATGISKVFGKIPGMEGTGQELGEKISFTRTQVGEGSMTGLRGRLELLKSTGKSLWGWGTALALAGIAAKTLWKTLKDVSDSAAELTRRIGNWNYSAAATNHEFATSVDWIKTATNLADKTGMSIDGVFSANAIANAAEFKNLTGATAEQANSLLIRSRLVNQTVDQYRDSLTKGANVANGLHGTIVNLREVQNGVLDASDATALSYGNNAEVLGRAVVAAKSLGMELSGIEKVSQSLINFSSSVESEMQAQLLTGHQLNLAKAREYALWNDLEGVVSEIEKQGVTAADFTKMNVIQQENMAKALGMSRDELAKSLILRQLHNGASAEALAAATGMKKEQIEAIGLTERWKKTTEKLSQSFITILEAIEPVVGLLSKLVRNVAQTIGVLTKWMGMGKKFQNENQKAIAGTAQAMQASKASFGSVLSGFLMLGVAVGPVAKLVGRFFGSIAGSAKMALHPLKTLKKGFAGIGGAAKAKAATGAAGTASVGANTTKGTGKNLSVLGKNLKNFYRSMQSITAKNIGTAIAVGFASAIAAPGIGLLAAVSNIPHKGLNTLGESLGMFFNTLGKAAQNPYVWLGVALFAAIGATLIPFTYALSLLAPLVESVGKAIGSVLTAAFDGLSKVMLTLSQVLSQMTFEDIGKLALLGVATVAFSTSILGAIPGLLLFGLMGLPVLLVTSLALDKLAKSSSGIESLGLGISNLISPLRELAKILDNFDENKLEALTDFGIGVSVNRKDSIAEVESGVRVTARRVATRAAQNTETSGKITSPTVEALLRSIDNSLKNGKTVVLDVDKLNRELGVFTVKDK